MINDDIPDDKQINRLIALNQKFDEWEERLNKEEDEISKLEGQLDLKESMFLSIENNLRIIEDRQNRFEKLLSIYEEQSRNTNPQLTRSEVLDKAKSLSRNLEEHQQEIINMNENVTTLKDMIYLISDIHCKFSKLKKKIAPYHELDEEDFEDQEEEDY